MKRVVNYLLGAGLFLAILLLLLPVAFYVPAVQRYALDKGLAYVRNTLRMEARVEHFSLTFPLELHLRQVYLGKSVRDTLAYAGDLRVAVSLPGLLQGQVRAERVSVREARVRWANDSTGMGIRADVPELELNTVRWRPGTKRASIEKAAVTGGTVEFTGGASSPPDTVGGALPDWVFLVRLVELREVAYRMRMQRLPFLQAGLGAGAIRDGVVDLGRQRVQAREVELREGGCTLRLASGTPENAPASSGAPEHSSPPWTVEADRLDVEQFSFEMGGLSGGKVQVELTDIGLTLKEIYNRGTAVRAGLEQLRLVRPQGGEISDAKADVDLDTLHTRFSGVSIRTPHSSLRLEAEAAAGVADLPGETLISLRATGTVGAGDVRLFQPELASGWKTALVDAALLYRPDFLRADRLELRVSGSLSLTANGQISGYTRPEKLNGRVHIRAKTENAFAERSFGGVLTLPAGLDLTADLTAVAGELQPRVTLCRKEGYAELDGACSFASDGYNLHLKTERFDWGAFLPQLSARSRLGEWSAELHLSGHGLQPDSARASLLLEVERGVYNRHPYRDIRLTAHLQASHVQGVLQSGDSAALLHLGFDATFRREPDSVRGKGSGERRVEGRIRGRAERMDLRALHFADTVAVLALNLSLEGGGNRDSLRATLRFDSLRIDEGRGFYALGAGEFRLAGQPGQTEAGFTSGDLQATFRADTALPALADCFENWGSLLQQQVTERKIALQRLADTLPLFHFELKSGPRNAPVRYWESRGIWYRNLYAAAGNHATTRGKELYARIGAEDPVWKSAGADTLACVLEQRGSEAVYSLLINGPQGLSDDFYSLRLAGYLSADGLQAAFRQQNRKGATAVETGLSLSVRDSSLQISLFPENPVFGYVPWKLNENNHITLHPDRRIQADLLLSSGKKQIRLKSQEGVGEGPAKWQIQVQEIDLSALSDGLPALPRLGGKIDMDVLIYNELSETSGRGSWVGNGRVALGNLSYEQRWVGDLRMDLNYRGTERLSRHTADLKLAIDGVQRLEATGEAVTNPEHSSLRVDADIPSLPLSAAAAFVPDGLLEPTGELRGELRVRGTLQAPEVDGGFSFRNARITPVLLGTSFAVDSSRLPVQGGEVAFRDFTLLSDNRQPLKINGTIHLLPVDRMRADLSVSARNFQAVNVRSNPHSSVFGKAYTDIDMVLKGPLSALAMTGNIRVLNSTDITYVMHHSAPELRDHSVDLVRFLAFDDTLRPRKKTEPVRNNTGGFALKLYVDIAEAVRANINLSEEGDDRIQIQGGGNLLFAASPEEGNTLSGRYSLNGGTVRYKVPIVGSKTFDIRNGSYLEWAGSLDNPALVISAGASMRVNVVEESRDSRLVQFTALIRIEGSLNQPQVTFDLDAPNDQDIRNQLATLSPDERTKQAMNLLVYGNYSGPGTVSTGGSANNTINNFLAGELNQWSRRYLGDVGLTFGIDSYNRMGAEGQEVTRTDYSYQFSKHLFNDRASVKIGGHISTDGEPGRGIEQNLVGDISIEYALTRNRNWFLKAFRRTNYESVLEGEVTQTGVGVLLRKSFNRVKDLFVRKSKRKKAASGDE